MNKNFTLPAACLFSLLAALLVFATPGSAGLTDGLIAYYPLDDSAADYSWNGNNGTLYGNPVWTHWTLSKVGSAVSLDGYNDYIRVANSSTLNPIQQISVSGWIYLQKNGQSTYTIVDKDGYWSSWRGYSVKIKNEGLSFELFNPYRTVTYYPQGGVPNSGWIHFAVTYDGASMRLYYNGDNVSSLPATGPINLGAYDYLYIGSNSYYAELWSGRLDDIRIYNRTLSGSEVAELYNSSSGGGGPTPDGSISGSIVPAFAGATITTDGGGYATTLPNGYFYMDHIAGTFTLTATADGCTAYSTSVVVLELQNTDVPASLSCTWTSTLLSSSGQSFPSGGGTGSVAVTISGSYSWTATSNHPDWITITGGSAGTGTGTVFYSVASSPFGTPRTGTLTIAGQFFSVTQTDTIPPAVTGVTTSSPSRSLTVPVTISASDNRGDTIQYLVTASSAPPASSEAGWATTNPFSYTVAAAGAHSLYGWAKDATGNVSLPGDPVTVIIDITAPVTTANPTAGTYGPGLTVTLSANEKGAIIYYTTNDTTPSESSSVYSSPIPISSTTKLRFFAKDPAGNSEAVKTEVYIQSVSMGNVNTDATVDLTDAVLALQVLSGITPAQPVSDHADVTMEGQIGLAEAIYILQKIAGLR